VFDLGASISAGGSTIGIRYEGALWASSTLLVQHTVAGNVFLIDSAAESVSAVQLPSLQLVSSCDLPRMAALLANVTAARNHTEWCPRSSETPFATQARSRADLGRNAWSSELLDAATLRDAPHVTYAGNSSVMTAAALATWLDTAPTCRSSPRGRQTRPSARHSSRCVTTT
jgi:hypothetical protein